MDSREVIRRIVAHDAPPRVGWSFNPPHEADIGHADTVVLSRPGQRHLTEWCRAPELIALAPDFPGELRLDAFGNLYGRLDSRTNGECVRGVYEDGWHTYDGFAGMRVSESPGLADARARRRGQYLVSALPVALFSTLRDARMITNALMDTAVERARVRAFLSVIVDIALEAVELAARHDLDAVMIYDDWGTQTATLISPMAWRELFMPGYARVADAAHARGLHLIVHSCGQVRALVPGFIEAGVDMLQFDQPELLGIRFLAEFRDRASFWCPVDIQKTLQTGDRAKIEAAARGMLAAFEGGGLIAKDYPSLGDIHVPDEWAGWAREVFVREGWYRAL